VADITLESVLATGRAFSNSRILLTGAELGLFTLLDGERLAAGDIASKLAIPDSAGLRPLTTLLDALAALGYLSKSDGLYTCPEDMAMHLSAKSPRSGLPMLLHSSSMWSSWSRLTAIVRGRPDEDDAGGPDDAEKLRAFIDAMHVVGGPMAEQVISRIEPRSSRALLDVGGASGTYTMAFLKASPEARATIFDRPPVIEMARERLEADGFADRVALVGGDFSTDELPGGHDLALLSAIIHQNSRRQNVELYGKIIRALVPGGRLIIRDHIMSPDRLRPVAGAVFAINMLVATRGGGTYTFDEVRQDLENARFTRVRLLDGGAAAMDGLVEARKPIA